MNKLWIEPITDRTFADVVFARENRNNDEHLKGAQNYSDWQRLTSNMYFLSDVFNKFGYPNQLNSKNIWNVFDLPTPNEITQIKNDIDKLRSISSNITQKYYIDDIPALPYTHYEKINIIENILFRIKLLSDILGLTWRQLNTFQLGNGFNGGLI